MSKEEGVEKEKVRRVVTPKERVMVARVYHFLVDEYKFMKEHNHDKCDLSPLVGVTRRTAEACGVSCQTVTKILKEEKEEKEKRERENEAEEAWNAFVVSYKEDFDTDSEDEDNKRRKRNEKAQSPPTKRGRPRKTEPKPKTDYFVNPDNIIYADESGSCDELCNEEFDLEVTNADKKGEPSDNTSSELPVNVKTEIPDDIEENLTIVPNIEKIDVEIDNNATHNPSIIYIKEEGENSNFHSELEEVNMQSELVEDTSTDGSVIANENLIIPDTGTEYNEATNINTYVKVEETPDTIFFDVFEHRKF